MKTKKLNEWIKNWWNNEGNELCDLLSVLSGDESFHEKLDVTDIVNIYNFAKSCKVPLDSDSENYLLKEICGELAEQALASKHKVPPENLFDEDGNFYEQYQDEFNRFFDLIEEQFSVTNNKKNNLIMKTLRIFTTGAFLRPVKVKDDNGNDVWLWAVSQFEDDSYLDGEICDPVERADTIEELLSKDNE